MRRRLFGDCATWVHWRGLQDSSNVHRGDLTPGSKLTDTKAELWITECELWRSWHDGRDSKTSIEGTSFPDSRWLTCSVETVMWQNYFKTSIKGTSLPDSWKLTWRRTRKHMKHKRNMKCEEIGVTEKRPSRRRWRTRGIWGFAATRIASGQLSRPVGRVALPWRC